MDAQRLPQVDGGWRHSTETREPNNVDQQLTRGTGTTLVLACDECGAVFSPAGDHRDLAQQGRVLALGQHRRLGPGRPYPRPAHLRVVLTGRAYRPAAGQS